MESASFGELDSQSLSQALPFMQFVPVTTRSITGLSWCFKNSRIIQALISVITTDL